MGNLLSLLWFLLIGLVAGVLAGQIMKGGAKSLVGDMVVGVVGAMVGGLLIGLLGFSAYGLIAQLITATVGACVCIAGLRALKKA